MRLLVKDPDGEYDFWLIQTHHKAPLKTETAVLVQGEHKPILSHPVSRSDPIGGSELSSGCETIYWDSLPDIFFKAELVPVGMAHIL